MGAEIQDLVTALLDGWTEKIEFAVSVPDHTPDCAAEMIRLPIAQLRHHDCLCPRTKELRCERRKQGALALQLTEAQYSVPVGDGGPSGPNKSGSKPPGNLLRPDEILSRMADAAERWATDVQGYTGVVQLPIPARLRRAEGLLRDMAAWEADAIPEDARDAAWALRGIVRQARVFLGYDSDWQLFEGTVCGECGGGLKVERGTAAVVWCAGSPEAPACGASYPWQTWLDMVPAAPRLLDTEAVCRATGVRKGTLYSWASRGQVTRYGTKANGGALWDLSEIRARVEA